MEAIAAARRPSTLKVYEAKWRIFSRWCAKEGLPPLNVPTHRLADFFLFLFKEKNLAPITIKGYRSMISDTYRHHGRLDVGVDQALSDLLASFQLARPVSRSLVPRWNLPWVLTWLTKGSYEPLATAPLHLLTKKTCFLIALASAARVSEIHALSMDPSCLQFRQDGSVSLTTAPGFIAKNRLPELGNQSINIPPLQRDDKTSSGRFNDPVRALRIYLRRTEEFRRGRTRLFLPLQQAREDIATGTISYWIRSVIRDAYTDLSPDVATRLKIKAHEVRAVATSTAFVRNCALKDVIKAVGWRSDSTFASAYLRDMGLQRDNLAAVGPLVAAQHSV